MVVSSGMLRFTNDDDNEDPLPCLTIYTGEILL